MNRVVPWDRIELVVLDMDGTLYDQGPVRRQMAWALAMNALKSRSLQTLRLIGSYRSERERLAQQEQQGFETALLRRVAELMQLEQDVVSAAAKEWLERRPLAAVAAARKPLAREVVAALRGRGAKVAVLSDYPAEAKLEALGIEVDIARSACDRDILVQKPVPKGLQMIMREARSRVESTIVIGDRDDRDGEIARRVGAQSIIFGPGGDFSAPLGFKDRVFAPLLGAPSS